MTVQYNGSGTYVLYVGNKIIELDENEISEFSDFFTCNKEEIENLSIVVCENNENIQNTLMEALNKIDIFIDYDTNKNTLESALKIIDNAINKIHDDTERFNALIRDINNKSIPKLG